MSRLERTETAVGCRAHLHVTRQQLDTDEGQRRDEEAEAVEDLPEAGDPQPQGRRGAGPVKQPASGGEQQHAQGGKTRQQAVLQFKQSDYGAKTLLLFQILSNSQIVVGIVTVIL